MDQLQTESSRLLGPGQPSDYVAWALGKVLAYPTGDIPTVEDWQREQGQVGIPSEDESATETGRGALDYLTMAHGLANLLRGGGSAAQELMGKRRGQETFGKEMMDTSRRAQPRRWREMELEDTTPVAFEASHAIDAQLPAGRRSYEDQIRQRGLFGQPLAPGENPQWRRGEMKPADVVEKGPMTLPTRGGTITEPEVYRIGEMVALPGGQQAQYVVIPSGLGYHVALYDGTRLRLLDAMDTGVAHAAAHTSMGEALAKARQLQNRLALAAKDFVGLSDLERSQRNVRFPWERGTSPNVEGVPSQGRGPLWRWDIEPSPPSSGRWGTPSPTVGGWGE